MTAGCVSVIIPVYNEEGNIAPCIRGLTRALAGIDHEILVCYDFDGDTTLGALERMEDRPGTVKPVRNTLGRGAAFAIRAGFQAARGDVLVTTMADLSDPPDAIPAMARKIREEGADVVSGSRYMKGGSQTGGPRLKVLLSRLAGLSLRLLAGLETHDATTNFRAYSRRFIETVAVESRTGMEVALELTVKAHLAGRRVDEVPSTWQDRSTGESRFRLWAWMPRYLRWYLLALGDPLFVWGVLAATAVAAIGFAVRHAPILPCFDEWFYIPLMTGRERLTISWFWDQHCEHRIPLPKLLWYGVTSLSGMDSRWGAALNVLLLAGAAGLLVVALRRFRGRTVWMDAFVPLLLLHWDHWDNMTWPFQIAFVLHFFAISCILALFLGSNRSDPRRLALPVGLCLAILPLVGSSTLPYVAVLTPWWAWVMLRQTPRVHPLISLGLPGVAVLQSALYTLTFSRPIGWIASPGLGSTLQVALQFMAGSLGFKGTRMWPTSGWIALAALGLVSAVLVRQILRARPGRLPSSGLALILGGTALLAFFVGSARSGYSPFAGFFDRYVTLACFFPLIAYVSTEYCGPPLLGRVLRISLAAVMAALVVPNARHAYDVLGERRYAEASVIRDIRAGLPVALLSRRHGAYFYGSSEYAEERLQMLADARLSAYRTAPPPLHLAPDGPVPETIRLLDGRSAASLRPGAGVEFSLPPDSRQVRMEIGSLAGPKTRGRIHASLIRGNGRPEQVLSENVEGEFRRFSFRCAAGENTRLRVDVEAAAESDARVWLLVEAAPAAPAD